MDPSGSVASVKVKTNNRPGTKDSGAAAVAASVSTNEGAWMWQCLANVKAAQGTTCLSWRCTHTAIRLSLPRNDSQRTDARGSAQTTSRLPPTGSKGAPRASPSLARLFLGVYRLCMSSRACRLADAMLSYVKSDAGLEDLDAIR
jgi:hypothetical protein